MSTTTPATTPTPAEASPPEAARGAPSPVEEDLDDVVYPDSDGQPMADNTEQLAWIFLLVGNLDVLRPDDFVGGDLLWYPVKGRPDIRAAPDALVVPGRPKGRRGSYIQHREEGIPPKVVFEVLSPSNTPAEMTRKGIFYHQYGADEFIVIDPDTQDGFAFARDEEGRFQEVPSLDGWTSPFLGIRFAREDGRLVVYRPDGVPFKSFAEAEAEAAEAQREAAEAQREAAEAQREAAEAQREAAAAQAKLAEEAARAARLEAKLRALGVDP